MAELSNDLSLDDLEDERAELLPDREVLSLLADPTSMQMPSLLGGATPDAGAGSVASGAAGTAAGAGHYVDGVPTSGAYAPTQTATAG